jgi:hypothetical protein
MTKTQTKNKTPNTPKKAPPKHILPSSRYYPNNNNNNLTNENLNAEEVNINEMVNIVKKHAVGNKAVPYHHPKLNYKAPKMKLPSHIRGGTRRRKHRKSLTRRR